MGTKISALSQVSSIATTDLILVSQDQGGGTFISKAVTGSTFVSSKYVVVPKTSSYSVQTTDTAKTLTMSNTSSAQFTLPSVGASDLGIWYTFVKLSTGKLIIATSDSDVIADSSAPGTIYNNVAGETYATLVVELANTTQWVITGSVGTWITA